MYDVPVYPQEIKDGIAELIKASSTIEYVSDIFVSEPQDTPVLTKMFANLQTQPDLFYFDSILVSTGFNDNDDVFTKLHTWRARKTPVDKPVNIDHNQKEIIGHMISAKTLGEDKKTVLAEDIKEEDIPDMFHIAVSAVGYRAWNDEELLAKYNGIYEEIKSDKNEWKVSMECLAPDFNFAVLEPSGSQHIIARSKKTQHLTKFLKCFGGTGLYQGCKIGRAPINFIFSGKGLTKNPANPDSDIIKAKKISSTKIFKCIASTEEYTFPEDKEKLEMEELEKLKAELEAAKKENETLKASYSETSNAFEALKQAHEAQTQKTASLESSVNEYKAKLEELNKKTIKAERTALLVDKLGVDNIKADKLFEVVANLSDEDFQKYLEVSPKEVTEKPKETVEKPTETLVAAMENAKTEVKETVNVPDTNKNVELSSKMSTFFASQAKVIKKKEVK